MDSKRNLSVIVVFVSKINSLLAVILPPKQTLWRLDFTFCFNFREHLIRIQPEFLLTEIRQRLIAIDRGLLVTIDNYLIMKIIHRCNLFFIIFACNRCFDNRRFHIIYVLFIIESLKLSRNDRS